LIKKRKVARVTPKKQTPELLFEKLEEVLVGETCKVKMIKEDTVHEETSSDIVTKIQVAKPKKITLNKTSVDLITRIMHFLGGNGVSHQQVLKIIQTEGGHGLRLDSTWKESWAIMQEMVKANLLEKKGSSYNIK